MKTNHIITVILALLTFNCHADELSGGLNLALDDKLFIYAAGGTSKLNVDTSLAPNTTLNSGALDESGGDLEIGVGYKHSNKLFTTFALQRNNLKIANINNVYGSINYLFPTMKAKPFVGAVVGYSQLKWSERPHTVLINEDLTSNGLMYGIQAGIGKKVRKNISVFMKYQFINYNHKMEIVNNTSNIEHKSGQNILLGMRYLF